MTIHKEDATTDADPIQIWSIKDLDNEFTPMLKAYADKETEFNWEAREKAIIRMKGLLRGNAVEPPFLEAFIPYMRQMIDGIIKAVESLRTQLAVKALSLVGDIGIYMGKHVDSYMIEQIMMCMMRCASLTKKIVANASLEATKSFLKHTPFHLKVTNMLNVAINDKNIQARLYTIIYTKTLLQAHAHKDNVRALMDRSYATDHFETILTKGLNDATPAVKEACREAFWIFWDQWRDKGEHILKKLPPAAQKQLEKSRSTALKNHPIQNYHRPTSPATTVNRSLLRSNSPTMLPRATSSLERREANIQLSPSNSNTSNGSAHSNDYPRQIKRSASPRTISPRAMSPRAMNPRAMSPHLRAYATPPTASISSQLTHHHNNQQPRLQNPSTSTSPTGRKTRVPTLARKKSTVGLFKKAKPHFMALLTHEDPVQFNEGLLQLAKKLSAHPHPLHSLEQQQDGYSTMTAYLKSIRLEVPQAPPADGEAIKSLIAHRWDQDSYEILSSWEGIANILFKLFTFEEIISKLIIDANRLEQSAQQQRSAMTTTTTMTLEQYAQVGLDRAKLFLYTEHPNLTETVFASLIQYGGFVSNSNSSGASNSASKKDVTRLPANRRKLTKYLLEWMDELLRPLIGLPHESSTSERSKIVFEGVPEQYIHAYQSSSGTSVASLWFQSEENIRQCLAVLLPLITTSTFGTIWHAPLVTFLRHLRQSNQRMFEAVISTYDGYSINKIGRVLGVHIRAVIPATTDLDSQDNLEAVELVPGAVDADELAQISTTNTDVVVEQHENSTQSANEDQFRTDPTMPLVQIDEVLYPNSTSPILEPLNHSNKSQLLLDKLDLDQSNGIEQHQEQQNVLAVASNMETANDQPTSSSFAEAFGKLIPELPQERVATQDDNDLQSSETKSTTGFFDTVTQMKQQEQNHRAAGLVTAAVPDSQTLTTNDALYIDENNPLGLTEASDFTQNRYHPGDPAVSSNELLDLRTGSEAAAAAAATAASASEQSNLQPMEQQTNTKRIILQPSTPDSEKYPDPHFVPFYAPERVNFPNPVFRHNVRSQSTHPPALVMSSSTQTSTLSQSPKSSPQMTSLVGVPGSPYGNGATNGGNGRLNPKDKTVLLYALIDKLKNSAPTLSATSLSTTTSTTTTTTITTTLRKLTRLFKEVPIRRRWDQGGIEETGSETWAGAQGEEAGNFVEVLQAILPYLTEEKDEEEEEEAATDVKAEANGLVVGDPSSIAVPIETSSLQQQEKIILVALESIRQLAVTQAGLFRFYERKVDDKGRTLESQLMERLLQIRSSENPTVCIAAEDALDAVLGALNPPTVFEMLMAYVVYRLIISPSMRLSADARYHPVGSAFMYLTKWVKELNDHFYIDEWLTSRGGVNAFFKGINHPRINVRKSCIEALVAFQEVLGDELYGFFTDLREDQLALLKHYAAKASKKKIIAATVANTTPLMMRRDNTSMTPTTTSY